MKKQLLSGIITVFAVGISAAQTPFSLPPLPYDVAALEPYIDSQTMTIHHDKHHQAYVTNLNKAVAAENLGALKLEDLLKSVSKYSDAVRNNAGGHYNHSLFWTILTPNKGTQPSSRLLTAINEQLGGLDSLKIKMEAAATKRFGSGWAWLSVDSKKKLFISSTPNQDNPLMDVVDQKGTPILGIDVWEHAYYLKYQNKRPDYLKAIWNVINWDEVSKLYDVAAPKGKFDDWPQIKDFHKTMSQTFHPSEEGNLEPLKTRSGELVLKAEALAKNPIPAPFDKKEVKKAVADLVKGSKKLNKLVKSKAADATLTKEIAALHDVFHTIVGLCSSEDAH